MLILNKQALHLKGIIFFFFITLVFNILFPEGSVLFRIFNFTITSDALLHGSAKALSLLELLYLSKLFIRPTVFKPQHRKGKVSLLNETQILLAKTFYYFYCLVEQRKNYKLNKLWQSLDEIVINAYKKSRKIKEQKMIYRKSTWKGILFIGGLVASSWYFVLIQYIY